MKENVKTSDALKDGIEKVISEKIRPFLQADGGDIELLDVEDGVVRVRLQGACHGCPGAMMTLKAGVERLLKEEYPEIKKVVPA
jgi:Fe-S cluster biogenesis protein NfuA